MEDKYIKPGDIVLLSTDWSGDGIQHYAEIIGLRPKTSGFKVKLLDKSIRGSTEWGCRGVAVVRIVSSG